MLNLNFYKGINIICGKNGQGKTNLLESIYFGNFYYEYTDRVVDNKDTYMIKKKID